MLRSGCTTGTSLADADERGRSACRPTSINGAGLCASRSRAASGARPNVRFDQFQRRGGVELRVAHRARAHERADHECRYAQTRSRSPSRTGGGTWSYQPPELSHCTSRADARPGRAGEQPVQHRAHQLVTLARVARRLSRSPTCSRCRTPPAGDPTRDRGSTGRGRRCATSSAGSPQVARQGEQRHAGQLAAEALLRGGRLDRQRRFVVLHVDPPRDVRAALSRSKITGRSASPVVGMMLRSSAGGRRRDVEQVVRQRAARAHR